MICLSLILQVSLYFLSILNLLESDDRSLPRQRRQNVDKFFTWVQIKKNTQGRPNECQIVYLGITIKLIDRS
jgi:hypothetical protein